MITFNRVPAVANSQGDLTTFQSKYRWMTHSVDICVCTFRRAHIEQTLLSLEALLRLPDWTCRIIVVDNDDTDSAREIVTKTAAAMSLPVTYIHAPGRNISIARNTCLEAATATFVAFVDDDELVTPTWLGAMLTAMESSDADVVLGPVESVYDSNAPRWMRDSQVHGSMPSWIGGEIKSGYSSNVMFCRTAKPITGQRFLTELGRSGGEDTVFFSTIYNAGGKIIFAPNALTTEIVPPNRAHLSYVMGKSFQQGEAYVFLLAKHGSRINKLKSMTLAIVKSFICIGVAMPLFGMDRSRLWLLRGTFHVGVVARLLGKKGGANYGV